MSGEKTTSIKVVRELSPVLGVEIDLEGELELSAERQAELQRLFDEHHLLLIRDVTFSYEQQRRFAGYLGPTRAVDTRSNVVSNTVATKEGFVIGEVERMWHSDWAFTSHPCVGVSLHAIDVGHEVTSTRFANAVRACLRLPQVLRERIRDLEVVHYNAPGKAAGTLPPDVSQRYTHPVVLTHPRTGVDVLYVPALSAAEIVGLDPDESVKLLDELMDQIYEPTNIYEHWWRLNDFVIWDNVSLQHARDAAPPFPPRTLQRVVLAEFDLSELVPEYTTAAVLPQHRTV